MEELNKINKDYVFQEYMTKEEDDEKMMNTRLIRAERKGIELGVEQNKIEIAKNMLSKNMNIDDIVETTCLTTEEIEKILD